jgi:cell division septal protein FtsQ
MRRKRNRYRVDRKKQLTRLLRWGGRLLWLPLGVAGVLLISAAFAHSYHALLELPWLQVEDIEIQGLQRLTRAEVISTMAISARSSVFKLRTVLLAKRLQAHPWIQSAVVRIDPPRRLTVEITERSPVAMVYAQSFVLLDGQGKLFLQVKPEGYPNLPLVTGLSGANLGLGDALPVETFRVLQNLLLALNKSHGWLPAASLSELQWRHGEGFTMYTTHGAIPVHLGTSQFDQKLARLQSVMQILSERQWWAVVRSIDLDYPRHAYVRGPVADHKGI